MTKKIFRSILFTACVVLLTSLVVVMTGLYGYFSQQQTQRLKEELSFAVQGVELAGGDYLEGLTGQDYRLTWVEPDGTVAFDSVYPAETLENHALRREIQQAMEQGEGSDARRSATGMRQTVYYARLLSGGTVLRIATDQVTVLALVFWMFRAILFLILLALIISAVLADRLSRQVVKPLNELDLDHPLENATYDELSPLLKRINQQRGQIQGQVRVLRQKQDEFEQITASMKEGLVLLKGNGQILAMNPASQRLFHADDGAVGQDFLTVERDVALHEAIAQALEQGHGESRLELEGREYQIELSRIESEGQPTGVVLLAFDITEKARAERSRREFSANVSHELKTPLTTILASSELIEKGMVKDEDLPRFVGHIRSEAARLLALIEDIMRLSQLDEGQSLSEERLDLAEVVLQAAEPLKEKAEQSGVELKLDLSPSPWQGVARLCSEIAFNLMDNAIKYNVPGGRVTVTVRSGVLTVADTGIGIPPEQQDRVFERFYRVDKSHSRQIGGTGLGLAIVKHACGYLNASLSLESSPGAGTTVTVTFPPPTQKEPE